MISKIKNKLGKDANLKEILSGSAITFVLKMGGMALGFLLIYLISKRTGAEGVGFYQVLLQILTVLGMVLGLGMNISVLRYVGQFNNEENRPKMHLLYSYIVKTIAPLTAVIGILIYFSANYVTSWLDKEPDFAIGLKVVGLILPFFTLNQISVEFIRGLKKLQISELVRSVLRPLVMTVAILLFFYDNLSKIDIIYLMAVGLIINSLVSRWTIWKELRAISKSNVVFHYKELMSTSFPMMLTSLSSSLLGAFPIFFLDYFTSQADVGVFSVAMRFATLITLVLVVVNTIAAPKYAELYWAGKKIELQKLISQSTKIMFWSALIFSIVLIGSGKWILQLFGEEYVNGYVVLVLITIGQFINVATGSSGVLLNMTGNQKILKNIIVTVTIISFPFYLYLTPKYGILAVALIAMSQSIVINFLAVYFCLMKLKLITFLIPYRTKKDFK